MLIVVQKFTVHGNLELEVFEQEVIFLK